MLLMLLPAWERGRTALAVHPRVSFHCGKKETTTTTTCPRLTAALQNHYQSYLALTVHKDTDILWMWCTLASLPLPLVLLSRLTKQVWGLEMTADSLAGGYRTDFKRMWRGGTLEAYVPTTLDPFLAPPRVHAVRKMSRKEGQSGDSATKQSVTLCAVVHPFHSSSPLSISPPPSLIGAHSLVFHHTYPHLNFTNPIYCYLYPWLLLSLLLLLLLLWLELLSSCAIFSFYFHGFKYWFSEQGGGLGNKRH